MLFQPKGRGFFAATNNAAESQRVREYANSVAGDDDFRVTNHAGGFQSTLPTTTRPEIVLPVNGVVPSETNHLPNVHLRTRTPKNFADSREAYACANWVKAVVAREYHRTIDTKAEETCRRFGFEDLNAGIESDPSRGGFLVPAPLERALIDIRDRVGVMPPLLRRIPMTSDRLDITKRTSGLTVYVGSENPAADMTASDKGWSQIKLIAEKRYVVHQISQELIDDALIAVVDDAIGEMGHALASQLDNEIVNGDGTSTYGGIVGLLASLGAGGVATAASGHDTWAELDIADFVACMSKLPDEFADNPIWVCSRSFYVNVMLRLMAAAGGNNFAAVQTGDGGRRMFLDSPVIITEKMPKSSAASTVSCLYGDFSKAAILGERTGIRVARSDDFAFLRDLTTLKATTRYDVKIHAPGTASVAGGYVGLKTAAS
jgi:HK97 family phage major capsid protein